MKTIASKIKEISENMYPFLIQIRRHLHQYPELSGEEFQTSAFISQTLNEWGIDHLTGIAGTGIMAQVRGKTPGNACIALRADMDALPIDEQNEVEYRSKNPGVMHACGHDVHVSSLLGTIKILQQLSDEYSGMIKCIFQPSEEKYPGGAIQMIGEGILKNPEPLAIFGQHVCPALPPGKVGFRPGKYMASSDEIYITVKGKGGHAATPHQNIDPVVIGAQILLALQQLISRETDPTLPTVLSFGKFIANGQTNIIPDEARLEGTLRTFDETWRHEMHSRIENVVTSMANAFGANCEIFIDHGYPNLQNDESLTREAIQSAKEFLGNENVVELDQRMTAEDFAYYAQKVPGCFYRLGVAHSNLPFASLHSAHFDVDENCLLTGPALMAWLALKKLDPNLR